MSEHKFKVGDRVRIVGLDSASEDGGAWFNGSVGTIIKLDTTTGYVGRDKNLPVSPSYGVRFDNYGDQYGENPTNCHTPGEAILELDTPSDDEIAEALRSIKGAS